MTEAESKPNIKVKSRNQVLAAFAASTLSLSVGCNVALSSSLIPVLINDGDIVSTFEDASWLATGFGIVAVPISILGGLLSDRFGRRKMGMLSVFPLLTGLILMATAKSFHILLAARCLCSFGIWIGFPNANVLVSEVSHPSIRGTLGVLPSILISTGLFTAYLLGYLFDSWRVMCWILLFSPVLSFCALAMIKESPYWLVQHERKEEAESSLKWYRGADYDVSSELQDLVKKREESLTNSSQHSTISIVFSKRFLKAQMCSGVLMFMYQFCGIGALVVYMVNIFQDAKLSFDPRLAPVLVGITRIFMGVCSSIALKKGNRKYIYCFCTLSLSMCTLTLASLTMYREWYPDSPSWLGYLPFPLVLLMFMAHSFGVVPVLQLITAEVFPTAIRSLGGGSVTCLGMGGTAIASAVYPYALSWVGVQGCFYYFSASALILSIYAFCVIPDNRGLSLTNIERGMEKTKQVP